MEIIPFLFVLVPVLMLVGGGILLIYFIIRRIRQMKTEDFQDRDN